MNEPIFLSIRESSERYRLHQNTIRNLIACGKLRAIRLGPRVIRINQADLDALFTPVTGGEYGVWSK